LQRRKLLADHVCYAQLPATIIYTWGPNTLNFATHARAFRFSALFQMDQSDSIRSLIHFKLFLETKKDEEEEETSPNA